MAEFQISSALLRTLPRLVARADRGLDQHFESGQGTKPATEAYRRQLASLAADRLVKQAARRRPTTTEREKEVSRRRKWAGGGNMPPDVRAGYSESERAALSVVADQCKRKGFCDLCLDEIARLAGVGRTSVQNALRKARSNERAHITVRERPQKGGKSLTNIIKIVCISWLSWITRAIGFKRLSTSESRVKISLLERMEMPKRAFERSDGSVFIPHLLRESLDGISSSEADRSMISKKTPERNNFKYRCVRYPPV